MILGALTENGGEPCLQLEPHAGFGVGDAEPEKAAEQLPERVVGNVLRVRDALRPQEPHAILEPRACLGDEPALADARAHL